MARHRQQVNLLAVATHSSGAKVLDSAQPAAYCLPGKPAVIVLTTATLDLLSPQEVDAVIGHERAHLNGRHQYLLTAIAIFQRSLAWIPGFKSAHKEAACLVELVADDVASRKHDRHIIASALLALAQAPSDSPGLAAANHSVAHRVSRLLRRDTGLTIAIRLSITAGVSVMGIAPISITAIATAVSRAAGACA